MMMSKLAAKHAIRITPRVDGVADDDAWSMQESAAKLLTSAGYQNYEVSAWSRDGEQCAHNLNYWRFGDYLGIGAGAHGKITLVGDNRVIRRVRVRQPKAYLEQQREKRISSEAELKPQDLVFEFMLNALRLKQGFASHLFHANTGLKFDALQKGLKTAQDKGFLEFDGQIIIPSELGFRFLNDLQTLFLDLETEKSKPFFDSSQGIIHN